jgi:S1-C subfamily serine protease
MLKAVLALLIISSVACQKNTTPAVPAVPSPTAGVNATGNHPIPENALQQRFSRLSCAIVTIANPLGNGTGFFINSDGDVMTAAHVVFGRTYFRQANGSVGITLTLPEQTISIADGGRIRVTTTALVQRDVNLASFDLAVVHTDHHTDCFIEPNLADSAVVGQHVLSIGHPALSGSAVLFDGFVSSIHQHLPIPIGYIGTTPVNANYQVLRLQMPILPGASGSPVISDDNRVIGVVSEVPMIWTGDLTELIQRGLGGSGPLLSGFDTNRLLAQLALVVHEFESPGSGLAVPISYMRSAPGATNQR